MFCSNSFKDFLGFIYESYWMFDPAQVFSQSDNYDKNNNNNTIFRQVCLFSWLAAMNQGPV